MVVKRTIVTETVTTEYKKKDVGEKQDSRILTVGGLNDHAFIRMSGKWLENAGFEIGDKFNVTVQENQLVLEKLEAIECTAG